MKEYIVRCENNKFTLKGEIVHCKECRNRHRQKRCAGRHSDWFCADGVKQVTGKLATSEGDESTIGQPKSKLESDLISRAVLIEDAPEAYRPSGMWINTQGNQLKIGGYSGYCSICHKWSEYLTDYCGNCGAYMVKENE